jgi:hypothetical protein
VNPEPGAAPTDASRVPRVAVANPVTLMKSRRVSMAAM